MKYLLALALFAFASAAASQEIRLPLTNVKIHDADTITADIALPWGLLLVGENIRESTYDAWEIRKGRGGVTVTSDEILKGQQASKALDELFKSGRVFIGTDVAAKRDSFGRLLGKYWVYRDKDWVDVRKFMEDGGHLRPVVAAVTSPAVRSVLRRRNRE